MNKKMYARGIAGQLFYNATEYLALALQFRPVPKNMEYCRKIRYDKDKMTYMNTHCLRQLKAEKKPLLIYIHGGGWISGVMEMRNSYIMNWAKQGFFTACVNYTWAPQKIYPEPLRELFTALDYLIDRKDELNIDTENVIIAGESAGGYYISYIISCINNPEILEKLNISFRHINDIKIKAMVSHCGAFDIESLVNPEKPQSKFPDIKMMLSTFFGMPLNQLREKVRSDEGALYSPRFTADFPPCYLTWCTRDYLRYETFELSEKFKELGIPFRLFKGDGIIGNHGWTIVTTFGKAKKCFRDTLDFVLPYLPEYFEKADDGQYAKKRSE